MRSCVCAYPPPFVAWARARGVGVSPSRRSSDGLTVSAAAGEVVARCLFVAVVVARLPSVALWRRVWPRVVFFCRSRLVLQTVLKGRLWAQFRLRLSAAVSRWRKVGASGGGPALFWRVCVGAHLPQPSHLKIF